MVLVPLNPSTVLDLRQERERLHGQKIAIEGRIAAIDAILLPSDGEQSSLPLGVPMVAATANTKAVSKESVVRGKSANNGLRAAALDVLKRAGNGRAPWIAEKLTAQGFTNDSNTPL